MNILEALDSPDLFGAHFADPSWNGWRAVLAAMFALPTDDDGLAMYRACTGRQTWPEKAFNEVCFVIGRRGGKSRILALTAVFLGCFRSYREYLAPGERGVIIILAASKDQARSIYRFVTGLLRAVPSLASMIESEGAESVSLKNNVTIEVAAASYKTVRGYSPGGGTLRRERFLAVR